MHRTFAWMVLLLTAALPGCTMGTVFLDNVAIDPLHYMRNADDVLRKCHDECLANEAWDRAQHQAPQPYSRHYARGFKEAYVDYLMGGDGNTPLVPPRRYWSFFYQSPEGYEAMQDWFAGWRHGNAMAKESGYRNLVIIPANFSVPDPNRGANIVNRPVDPKTGELIDLPRADAPTDAKPSDTKPSDAKPADGKPSEASKPAPPADAPKPSGEAKPLINPPGAAGPKMDSPSSRAPGLPENRPNPFEKPPSSAAPSGSPAPAGDKPKSDGADEYQSLVAPNRR